MMQTRLGKRKRMMQRSPWHDLPPELVGQVLCRIPSLADRVRFLAVCRSWRCAARQYPPPRTLPWLVLHPGGTSFILSVGGGDDRLPGLPGNYTRCCGTVDDLLVIVNAGYTKFSLFNPFTKAILPLPELAAPRFRKLLKHMLTCKVVVSSAGGPVPGCLVAIKNANVVIVFHPGMGLSLATRLHLPFGNAIDIAFYQGKLYALSDEGDLFAFEVNVDSSKLKVTRSKCIASNCIRLHDASGKQHKIYCYVKKHDVCCYLVESRGKLLMVVRSASISVSDNKPRTYFFEVLEVEFSASPSRWKRIEILDGEILFISESYSKSLPACLYDGEQGDRIYFTRDGTFMEESPLYNSCIFDMRDAMVKPFPPTAKPDRDKWFQAWLFPPQ